MKLKNYLSDEKVILKMKIFLITLCLIGCIIYFAKADTIAINYEIGENYAKIIPEYNNCSIIWKEKTINLSGNEYIFSELKSNTKYQYILICDEKYSIEEFQTLKSFYESETFYFFVFGIIALVFSYYFGLFNLIAIFSFLASIITGFNNNVHYFFLILNVIMIFITSVKIYYRIEED